MSSAIAFVATFLLAARDLSQSSVAIRNVRAHMLACDDSSEEHLLSFHPYDDAALLLETRIATSRFFDVPCAKIHRDVHFIDELHVDKFDPSFHFSVVDSGIASQPVNPKGFWFAMAGLDLIDDLTQAIAIALGDFDRDGPTVG